MISVSTLPKNSWEITNYSVTDIAYESGYSSPSLFIKTFKKLTSFYAEQLSQTFDQY
ncbi:DNA-binding transcriptional regulator ChbR [Klebsiella pneumoniae]|uniref:DNA-binding transcriptional regulator ChbR n=1 Tax=Klebsiella pneumoniae TaxID=573 RepID=A0A378BCZ0_KLEPN|nr:DNA-binding transcriptional regulator ChbR [Klebsiella pneumoniae]